MPYLESNRGRATLLIAALGVALIIGLAPYISGLLGGIVFCVVLEPAHRWMARRFGASASALVLMLGLLLLIIGPGILFVVLVINQAQQLPADFGNSDLVHQLSTLHLGPVDIGGQIAESAKNLGQWMAHSAIGLVGTVTRFSLNIVVALFTVYYLLVEPGQAWRVFERYSPFSSSNTQLLRDRFVAITYSTLIGTVLVAVVQGGLVGLGFQLTGLSSPAFWGLVTIVFAVLPIVGSGLVWGPAAVYLILHQRVGSAIFLIALGVLVVGNIDLLIRPIIFRRYAKVHPFVTVVGALAGIQYFGLMGLLVGPLAISYFFELLTMFHEEFLGSAVPQPTVLPHD
ncbi:MAG: AI-2E family transporter [Gemmatimonadota bacterium]